jgi:tRNA dimethylallyltransferase
MAQPLETDARRQQLQTASSPPLSKPLVVAILGPTATGKSAIAIELALRHRGEVVSCDSTAVYRGFDIGTDKVPEPSRRSVPHQMIDVVDPTDEYNAADYARDASRVISDIFARGRLPILAGGTGFYYRALTRGLFAGPGRSLPMRRRLERVCARRGPEFLHRMVHRFDPESARRIQPRDKMRLVRAIEVRFLTGRSLTDHFRNTVSPLPPCYILSFGLTIPPAVAIERISRRVDEQFSRGLLDEVRGLLARGVPENARPFTGLVYKQVLEYLHGVRDEQATRELIIRENRRYFRRQLIWFRKAPNLVWVHGVGEPDALAVIERHLHDSQRALQEETGPWPSPKQER